MKSPESPTNILRMNVTGNGNGANNAILTSAGSPTQGKFSMNLSVDESI